jgi:hydroxymethylpyrimidine/phosphomethylpyrimidine kinase
LIPVALTIAGSDPSGGAGIQADLKTFHQFGVYGEAAITLLTVQNTRRVGRVEVMPPSLVIEQIRAAIEDIPPAAAKTGALGAAGIVEAVAIEAKRFVFPLVVDPVMISKHGAPLMADSAGAAVRDLLLPVTTLLTPNLHEAAALTGLTVDSPDAMRAAARQLCAMGCRSVLVKGGHLAGDALDLLLHEGEFHEFRSVRFDTPHTHGTGCTYSAAITAELAKGTVLVEAVRRAKHFISRAIETNPGLGGGSGPVNHFAV